MSIELQFDAEQLRKAKRLPSDYQLLRNVGKVAGGPGHGWSGRDKNDLSRDPMMRWSDGRRWRIPGRQA